MSNIGLTARMDEALTMIKAYVARHGVSPSVRVLGEEMKTSHGNAQRLLDCLIERGALTRIGGAGPGSTLAFGPGNGVGVMLPPHIAAALAKFCSDKAENISAVVADAITLHIDAANGDVA